MTFAYNKHRRTVLQYIRGFPVGFNVNSSTYYNGAGLFSNKLYDATSLVARSNLDAKGYPQAGLSAQYLVISENVYEWWQYKPGTYVIKGTGSGATITTSGVGFANDVFATTAGVPFRRTVILPAMTAPTGDAAIEVVRQVHLQVAVSAAGTQGIPDLWVSHVDDESKYGGTAPADYFTAEAIADYSHPTRGPLRFMQMQNMTDSWVQDVADISDDLVVAVPTGYRNAGAGGAKGTFTNKPHSPEMYARLCVATNMDLWINAFVQMTDAAMAAFASRLAAIYTSGTVYGEVGNEPWNGSYAAINSGYLGSRYGQSGGPGFGAGLLTDGTGTATQQALGHASLRWWKALDTAFGAGRVKKLINVQLVQPTLSVIAMDYVDPGIRSTGVKVGMQMDAWCPATYPLICPDDTANGLHTARGVTGGPAYSLTISRAWMCQHKLWENSPTYNGNNADLWLEKSWRNAVDMTVAYMATCKALFVTTRGYADYACEYEGHWNHDDIPLYTAGAVNETPGMCVQYNATTGAMTPDSGTGGWTGSATLFTLADWFADGDIVEPTWAGPNGVADYNSYKCKIIAGELFAYSTEANYAANIPVTGKVTFTFTASVGGATSGTLTTSASIAGGTIVVTFSNGDVRTCTLSGGVNLTWTGALTAGTVMTGNVTGMKFLLGNISRMDLFTRWVNKFQDNLNAIDGVHLIDYMHNAYRQYMNVTASFTLVGGSNLPFNYSNIGGGGRPWAMKNNGFWSANSTAFNALKALT